MFPQWITCLSLVLPWSPRMHNLHYYCILKLWDNLTLHKPWTQAIGNLHHLELSQGSGNKEDELEQSTARTLFMALGPIADESLRVTAGWGKKGKYFGISSSGKLLNFDFLILKISKTLSSRVLWDERLHIEKLWGTVVKSVSLEPDCPGWNLALHLLLHDHAQVTSLLCASASLPAR